MSGTKDVKSTAKPEDIRERVWAKLSEEERLFFKQLNAKFGTKLVNGYAK